MTDERRARANECGCPSWYTRRLEDELRAAQLRIEELRAAAAHLLADDYEVRSEAGYFVLCGSRDYCVGYVVGRDQEATRESVWRGESQVFPDPVGDSVTEKAETTR